MHAILRPLLTCAVLAGLCAPPAVSGGIPSPFGEPETSRPLAKKKPAAEVSPIGDDLIKPSELPAGGGASPVIERETLAPLEAEPAPAAGAAGMPAPPPGARTPDDPKRFAPPALDEGSRTVMRDDLQPVMANDGSALPYELWQGMTIETIEAAMTTLEIPPRSPVLNALFRRLVTSDVPPPRGGASDTRFTAVRVEALHRSGLIDEAAGVLAKSPAAGTDPVLAMLTARTAIARGDREAGCRNAASMNAAQGGLPPMLKGQSILVRAYCAAIAGKAESAQLQVALARDEGVEESAGFAAIDAIASGAKPHLTKDQRIGPVDWRILETGGAIDTVIIVETAGPGVLAIISRDPATDPATRLAAAERAAQFNAITPAELAKAYREFGGGDAGTTGPAAAATKHAALFQAADEEATPLKKARLIRSFLDEARQAGLYWSALQIMAPAAASMQRVPEIGWFAETGVETALASGDYAGARAWADFGQTLDGPGGVQNSFAHWLALADLADPDLKEGRSRHLATLEELAVRGRFTPEQLHRLATVLDALQIQVPIPLWELASRTPQPNTGFLPETGVLSRLAEAAKQREFGHTVLLAMQALGPSGAEGAHMIALGDSIRALARAGLEPDARKMALEALFMSWPRTSG